MVGYHVTTVKKLKKYGATGCILSPVRFWKYKDSAIAWSKKTGRDIILSINITVAYPLPDHKPLYHAYWTPENIDKWVEVSLNE